MNAACLLSRVLNCPHLAGTFGPPRPRASAQRQMTITATEVWSRFLDRARTELPDHVVNTWLAPLSPAEFDGTVLTLTAPDQWSVEWNESKHAALLESYGPPCVGQPVKVALTVQSERVSRSQMDLFVPHHSASIAPRQSNKNVILSLLNDRYTFAKFVVGRSNELATAAATAVSQAPGRTYNPLFIYGSTGLGKTHLMQAIAHAVLQNNPGTRLQYFGAEQFIN